jgi:tetratricopeptide (TPR) repeat protein
MTMSSASAQPLQAARTALQNKRPWEAVRHLKSLLSTEPDHAEAREYLAIAHTLEGNHVAARQEFQNATRLAPSRSSAHFNYALFLFNRNELDEAMEENVVALFIDRNHAGALALQKQLQEKIRFRDYTADEGLAVVGSRPNTAPQPSEEWRRLQCPYCGGMNFVTAKVCKKCNNLIPEMEAIRPVE